MPYRTRVVGTRVVAAAVVSLTVLLAGAAGAVGAGTSVLFPVADASVREDLPLMNYGTQTGLRVDGSPVANAYLRFTVSVPADETVTRATLKMFTTQASGSGFTVHRVSDNGWGETTLNYLNAPTVESQVAAFGSYGGSTYISVDVTSLVTGSGDISMALRRTSTSSNTFASREAASNRPQLIVESAPPPPPPSSDQTVVYALGDGANGSSTSKALADYVRSQNPDRFFYLGDVYETGTAVEFSENYEPLYGPLAAITDPVIGNHEYGNRGTGYYPYWQNKRGWTQEQAKHRSYVDAASGWQIIAYSSETDMVAEGAWVAQELAKHAGTCRIVMAHKGRHVVVDTGHGDNSNQESVWSEIINRTAINLAGHNHIYGRLDPIDGVTVLISGAGGRGIGVDSLGSQHHAVAASTTSVATVTRLVLRSGAADFRQVDKNGTVYDAGTITCTPAP